MDIFSKIINDVAKEWVIHNKDKGKDCGDLEDFRNFNVIINGVHENSDYSEYLSLYENKRIYYITIYYEASLNGDIPYLGYDDQVIRTYKHVIMRHSYKFIGEVIDIYKSYERGDKLNNILYD